MSDKFSDKIKYFMGVDSNESSEESEHKDNSFVEKNQVRQIKRDTSTFDAPRKKTSSSSTTSTSSSKKVYNISRNRLKVVVHHPTDFNESQNIVENLKEEKPVIVNISKLENRLANKIFDFCSGALCALDGHMIEIDNRIFLLAPSNIDVTGDIKEELESKGMFNWLKE